MNAPVSIPTAATDRFSVRDYVRMHDLGAFADMNVELVRGELVKMMPGGFAHGEANGLLFAKLLPHYRGKAGLAIDLMVRTGVDTVRGIDIAAVRSDVPRHGPVDADDVFLAVEIAVSTLPRDLGEKRAEYAATKIATYWVVDVEAQVVHVLTNPVDGDYRDRALRNFDELLALPLVGGAITISE